MTRRAAPKPELAGRGPLRTGTPTCAQCGWTGPVIVDVQSPYRACGGDQARHMVTPLELGVRA